jgi:hypothetical protein
MIGNGMEAPGVGVVKSLERLGCGPVGLVHTQNLRKHPAKTARGSFSAQAA